MEPLWKTLRVSVTLTALAVFGACMGSPIMAWVQDRVTFEQKVLRSMPRASAAHRHATPKAAWEGTPLTVAAHEGNLEKVHSLLKGGAEVNAETGGWSAMEAAASRGHNEVVEALIEAGADVKGRLGRKALKLAVVEGHSDTAKLLIKSGVEVRGPAKNEYIPLAIRAGHPEMLAILHSADSAH